MAAYVLPDADADREPREDRVSGVAAMLPSASGAGGGIRRGVPWRRRFHLSPRRMGAEGERHANPAPLIALEPMVVKRAATKRAFYRPFRDVNQHTDLGMG